MEPKSSLERMISRRTLLERGLMLGVAATLGGTAAAETAKAAVTTRRISRAKKTLVIGGDSVGGDFAPAHGFQGWAHFTAEAHIYDSPYDYPNGDITKPLVPRLASAMPIRGRGNVREFVVPLRKGVKFHDGTPFTADAIVTNYEADIDKANALYDAKQVYAGVNFILGVSKVEALDDHRVKFTMNRPIGDFAAQLVAFAGSMSPTAIRKAGNITDAGVHPIGTGPYRFVEAVAGDHVTLEANPDYFRGKSQIDQIVIRAIPDPSALTAALLSGDVDVSWFVSANDVSRFQKASNLEVAFKPGVVTGYTEFNAGGANGVDTFTDVRVRQAALHAIDKKKLIAAALNGYGTPGAGVNPASIPTGWSPQFRDYYKFDPAKAKSLLKAAGGPRDVTLSVPSNLYWPLLGQVIQNDWNAVGLNTNLKVIDATVFGPTMSKAQHEVFIWDLTEILLSPWPGFNVLFNPVSANAKRNGGWFNANFMRLLYNTIAQPNAKKVRSNTAQMDKIILDNAVWQANYYPTNISVYTKRLHGFLPPSAKYAIFTEAKLT